ncbi:hypothetical protein IID62_07050 [candidate division KSB1 bacterium]|nr:hypothetical protein [candidate division KSB1 bacterium]
MDWIIQLLSHNGSLAVGGLTFVLSVFGAKKVLGKKINIVFGLIQETVDVISVFSRALKPDEDGKVRIDKQELKEIQKEISEMKKAVSRVIALG